MSGESIMDTFLVRKNPLMQRQTFIGLPDWDIGLFLIRKKVMLYKDTSPDFQKWYQGQIQSMTESQKKYKLK